MPIGTPPVILTVNAVYAGHTVMVSLYGNVAYDGDSAVTGHFKYKSETESAWIIWPIYKYGLNTADNFSSTLTVQLNKWYKYKACGANLYGENCGDEREFRLADETIEDVNTGADADDIITTFDDLLESVKNSLHLTGAMGNWAFLFLLLGILAILFGSVMFAQRDNDTVKTIVGVCWAIMSIVAVGGFIFTGQLGVVTILITVGAFVMFLMIILSVKLSGGNSNG